jgi:uracil-DNA glycosylase family 4
MPSQHAEPSPPPTPTTRNFEPSVAPSPVPAQLEPLLNATVAVPMMEPLATLSLSEPLPSAGPSSVDELRVVEHLAVELPSAVSTIDVALERIERIARLDWSNFASDVGACTACGLARTRNRTVPGVGDGRAEWMFVGEAPGAEEDAKGEPFVGQAGRLLDNMLLALGLSRRQRVYIANVLKCRPPGNRAPEPGEVTACRPYLERQVSLLQPRIIVALGRSAANTLLDMEATLASLRGRVHSYAGRPMIVTYHPAYLLRSLPDKAKAWEDLCLARATLRQLQDNGDLQAPDAAFT